MERGGDAELIVGEPFGGGGRCGAMFEDVDEFAQLIDSGIFRERGKGIEPFRIDDAGDAGIAARHLINEVALAVVIDGGHGVGELLWKLDVVVVLFAGFVVDDGGIDAGGL